MHIDIKMISRHKNMIDPFDRITICRVMFLDPFVYNIIMQSNIRKQQNTPGQ